MSRLIDADAIYPWYMAAFDFDPNEVRFSMNDIRDTGQYHLLHDVQVQAREDKVFAVYLRGGR